MGQIPESNTDDEAGCSQGPSHFHVLVPATPVDHAPVEPRVLAQAAFEVAA
jgi:hypothetical protein